MKSRLKWLVVMAIMVVFTWHCSDTPTGPEERGTNEVWILSNQFNPPTLTVTRGTKVTWTNKDSEPHSVDPGTFGNPTQDFLAAGNLDSNDRFSWTFSNSGTINYYCLLHPNNLKQGKIIVQ